MVFSGAVWHFWGARRELVDQELDVGHEMIHEKECVFQDKKKNCKEEQDEDSKATIVADTEDVCKEELMILEQHFKFIIFSENNCRGLHLCTEENKETQDPKSTGRMCEVQEKQDSKSGEEKNRAIADAAKQMLQDVLPDLEGESLDLATTKLDTLPQEMTPENKEELLKVIEEWKEKTKKDKEERARHLKSELAATTSRVSSLEDNDDILLSEAELSEQIGDELTKEKEDDIKQKIIDLKAAVDELVRQHEEATAKVKEALKNLVDKLPEGKGAEARKKWEELTDVEILNAEDRESLSKKIDEWKDEELKKQKEKERAENYQLKLKEATQDLDKLQGTEGYAGLADKYQKLQQEIGMEMAVAKEQHILADIENLKELVDQEIGQNTEDEELKKQKEKEKEATAKVKEALKNLVDKLPEGKGAEARKKWEELTDVETLIAEERERLSKKN